MKVIILSSILVFFSHFVSAQTDTSKNFVFLFSKSVVYGDSVMLRKNFATESYIVVNRNILEADVVKFFKNESGLYANIRDISADRRSQFYKRISGGKLNLFEKGEYFYEAGLIRHLVRTDGKRNYYNKGYGNLMHTNYANLTKEMASNPQSMYWLNQYKNKGVIHKGLFVVGSLAIAGGIATLFTRNDIVKRSGFSYQYRNSIVPLTLLFGSGLGCYLSSYIIWSTKPRSIKKAFGAYNVDTD